MLGLLEIHFYVIFNSKKPTTQKANNQQVINVAFATCQDITILAAETWEAVLSTDLENYNRLATVLSVTPNGISV